MTDRKISDSKMKTGIFSMSRGLRIMHSRPLLIFLSKIFLSFTALGVPLRAEESPVTAAQIHALSAEVADRALPVTLEGVVTFYDRRWNALFMQDASGGLYVKIASDHPATATLRAGLRVRVEGVTARGHFLPVIQGRDGAGATVRIIGEAALPEPLAVTGTQLTAPELDCRWVEISGVVRPPPFYRRDAVFAIEAEGRTFLCYLPEGGMPRDLVPGMLGVGVRVRAVAGTLFNDRRQMTGRVLYLSSLDQVQMPPAAVAADDGFQRPLTAFDDLLRSGIPAAYDRKKVRGIVTLPLANEGIFLRGEAGGGLWVQTSQQVAATGVRPGDIVEVAGWPEAADYRPDLRGGVFRVVGNAGARPEPVRVPAAELLAAAHHADLVEVQGSVVGRLDNDESTRLILSDGTTVFEARLLRAGGAPILPDWPRDTRLRLTGVCQNLPGEALSNPQRSPTFMIRLHRREDVQVLSTPPWWTTRRLLWGLAAAAGCALLAGGWAFTLRHRVAAQTRVIEAQVRRAGVAEERQRLARELHDSLEQEMTGVGLQLETALARMDGPPEPVRRSVENARRLLQRTQRETREAIWDLRTVPGDPKMLPGLLREGLAPIVESAGAALDIVCEGALPSALPRTITHHLLRIAHEAVSNALRHGQARRLALRLAFTPGTVTLTVTDDGSGFDPARALGATQGHFGLTGVRERAAKCGGSVDVISTPGRGTVLTFSAPLT